MGKSTEPPHDVAMHVRITLIGRRPKAMQRDRALLVGKMLGMLQRQQEKHPHFRLDRADELGGERAAGVEAGERVGGEHMRRAAKHVARYLVAQQHQRQRADGVAKPIVVTPRGGFPMQIEAGNAAARVEFRILGVPESRARLAPEADDLRGRRQAVGHVRLLIGD